VRELIDASPYAKKNTSCVLSFAEQDLPTGQREKLMASFERVMMPGLDKDKYSVLRVEHRDKGRLELNLLIPNTELQTGKRLQHHIDLDSPQRLDSRQSLVNGRLGVQVRCGPGLRGVVGGRAAGGGARVVGGEGG
ncbi:relaxase/mobilization nuclease domain-containing protein, partial [Enterobacter hormaechei subsp. xiangfangensis]|uniref:relaxase/mobilization nuclease domain-containing protein n=1 Tax=Enterobacter hormaechei TaxID=158836 RepID=UPI002877137B